MISRAQKRCDEDRDKTDGHGQVELVHARPEEPRCWSQSRWNPGRSANGVFLRLVAPEEVIRCNTYSAVMSPHGLHGEVVKLRCQRRRAWAKRSPKPVALGCPREQHGQPGELDVREAIFAVVGDDVASKNWILKCRWLGLYLTKAVSSKEIWGVNVQRACKMVGTRNRCGYRTAWESVRGSDGR